MQLVSIGLARRLGHEPGDVMRFHGTFHARFHIGTTDRALLIRADRRSGVGPDHMIGQDQRRDDYAPH